MESNKDVNFSTVVDFGLTPTSWTFVGKKGLEIFENEIGIDY